MMGTCEPQDVERIAEGLTEKQRYHLPLLEAPFEFLCWEGIESIPELAEKVGWESRFGGHAIYRLTPLGLAVHKQLAASKSGETA